LNPLAFAPVGEPHRIAADILSGSLKETRIEIYKGIDDFTGRADDGNRSIVVAIRGTASIHDWMVNLNDSPPAPGSVESTLTQAMDMLANLSVSPSSNITAETSFLVGYPRLYRASDYTCSSFSLNMTRVKQQQPTHST